jgi:hypothetical protein
MKHAVGLTIAAALWAGQAQAAEKPPVIDPKASYVLVEIQNQTDMVFAGTKLPGSLTIARYDPVRGDIRGGNKAVESAVPKGEVLRILISAKPLIKSKASRLYLVEIVPDLWVIEGAGNTSFSLGSLTFAAKPGEVVDLGVVQPKVDWAEGEAPKKIGAGSIFKMALLARGMPEAKQMKLEMRARTATDLALPKELAGRTFTTPQFAYGATFGNYAGGLINRIDGRAGRGRVADPLAVPAAPPPAPQ